MLNSSMNKQAENSTQKETKLIKKLMFLKTSKVLESSRMEKT
jgi:hypothetical protein